MKNIHKIAAIVLAAGKGTRIGQHLPKALYPIVGKPMLYYCLELIKKIPITDTYVVIGYKATDVKGSIRNEDVNYVYQKDQLGTANAAELALGKIKDDVKEVIVFNGDDSAFFEVSTIRQFVKSHNDSSAKLSFMSTVVDSPRGLGRVIRNGNKVVQIVEEKDASDEQKLIKEVNVGCYIFDKEWLRTAIRSVPKSSSGEYYITDLVLIALHAKEKVNNFLLNNKDEWRGINDQQELKEANEKMLVRLIKQKGPTVFILDIDNTLLDTDAIKKYVSQKLVKELIKPELLDTFWQEYDLSRERLGYVSIPEFSDSFAERVKRPEFSEEIRNMFFTIPFNKFVFDGVNEFIEYIDPKGEIAILTDGDLVYQPMKIKNLKISKYIDEMFVFEHIEHKSEELDTIGKIYKGRRKIVVDDKIINLESFKKQISNSIVIHLKQGVYKNLKPRDPDFKPDFTANNISEVTNFIRTLY